MICLTHKIKLTIAMVANNNITTMTTPKVQIESIQTVMPMKPTDRQSWPVSIPGNLRNMVFRRCLNIVLYYNKASDEDSGWMFAGWLKESLGNALLKEPMLGGRLKRADDNNNNNNDDDGGDRFEIVSNDSGVRLLEARIPMELSEFLDLKKENQEAEGEVVFWEDIDELSPQFSPLSYVQVTNFSCGGYSMGFSCSLLVADPLTMTSFLQKWAATHNDMISKSEISKLPIFYLPNLRKTGGFIVTANKSTSSKINGRTFIFDINESSENLDSDMKKTIASLSIEQVERKLGRELGDEFSLIIKEVSKDISVDNVSRRCEVAKSTYTLNGFKSASWDDLGCDGISVYKGNKPTCVSYWINSICGENVVMVVPFSNNGISRMKVTIVVPY